MSDQLREAVSTLSTKLEQAPLLAIGGAIQDALMKVGDAIGADRAYLFTLSEADDRFDNVLEWSREGIPGVPSRNRALPRTRLRWLMDQLSRRSCLAIDGIADLPGEAGAEQEVVESCQFSSMIVLALRHEDRLVGFIGFDRVQGHWQWPDDAQQDLSRVADIIAGALYRESGFTGFTRFAKQARKFMEPLPGMVFQYEVDSAGEPRIPFACEKFERFFGIPSETLQRSAYPLLDRIHDQDHGRVMAAISHSMHHLSPFHEEFRILADDECLHWVRGTAIPESQPASVIWHGYLTEITDQIASEQAVIDQGLWTQAILENIEDAIFSIDQKGIIQSVNRSAERLFGYRAGQMKGKRINAIMHDLDPEETAVTGEPREFEARRWDGSSFPVELQVTQITMNENLYFIGVVRDITQRKRSEKKIHRLAYFDPLTGLPNRRLLIDRMEQALSAGDQTRTAIFFLGLDNFRDLNDSLGHSMGDRYLVQVAERLDARTSESTTIARLGGDEFVVLMTGLDGNAHRAGLEVESVAEQLRGELAAPFQLDAHEYIGSFGIGIALSEDNTRTVEELLKQADMALRQAKKSGRNAVRMFSAAMQHDVERRLKLESDIRWALEQKQFALHYQPQIQADGSVSSVEALIRWHHPFEGLVSPGEFIPVCEETGLILDLGAWVIEAACEQLALWSRDESTAHLRVAINISMRQFHEPDFVTQVLAALDRTGAPAEQLELELTESLFVQDMEEAIEKMEALRQHGVRFALDDFGTGYSSLSYLKRLPLNQLKIDKSFVQDIRDEQHDLEIARVIVALANTLALEVIAEGVETWAQRRALASIGCHRYQGFLFARPMPISQLDDVITRVIER